MLNVSVVYPKFGAYAEILSDPAENFSTPAELHVLISTSHVYTPLSSGWLLLRFRLFKSRGTLVSHFSCLLALTLGTKSNLHLWYWVCD